MATAARVVAHEQTLMIEDRATNISNGLMEFGETKHTPWSDAEMLSAADIVHRKLLEQMQCLCVTVQDMGARMDGRLVEECKKKTATKYVTQNRNVCSD